VLAFGSAERLDLPWRRTREPWAILVSEVMLQQTQVARVVGPYERFLARFPDPQTAAAAGAAELVRAWTGLGYNRRAVALHRCAVQLVERHGGAVPDDADALRALPGVGEYTARAVLTFAFEEDVGVVETNVARVLARAVVGAPLKRAAAQSLADRLVPEGRSWEFNQALFDVGALYCRSRRPECGRCPLRRQCRWARAGFPEPDPAVGSAGVGRPQSAFAGSNRQGRGRLVAALRTGPLRAGAVPAAAGWPDDPARVAEVVAGLLADGLAVRGADGTLELA